MRRGSVRSKKSNMILWLNEYSEGSSEQSRSSGVGSKRNTHEASMIPVIQYDKINEEESGEDSDDSLHSDQTIRSLYSDLESYQALFNEGDTRFNSRKFNIFSFTKIVGREKTLPLLSFNMFL